MSTDIPRHLLVRRLSEALRDFGLEPSVETGASNGVELFISVLVGRDDVAVVMESHDRKEGRKRAEQATMRLLKRNDVKCAVAVCYSSEVSYESTEHPRYTWRVVHNPGWDSEWMTGGLAGLALTVTLAPAGPAEPSDAALTLAEDLSECNAGALVRIIPMAAATNETFAETRRLLARAYHPDFMMASHDGKRASFSGTGNKREVLLVCRPRSSARDSMSATQAINLAKSPSTAEGARSIATCIKQHIESGDESVDEFGSVQRVDYTELHDGDWGALHFLSPLLRRRFLQLKHGGIIRVTTLGAVAELNQTSSSVRRVFTPDQSTAQGMWKHQAFWGHDSSSARTMRVRAETRIWVSPKEIDEARVCWERGSRLLLPEQPYLPSVGAMAVRLDEATVGSMWTNFSIRKNHRQPEEYENALCVYLNSTLGMLAMLGASTLRDDPKRLWPTGAQMKSLPIPKFGQKDGAVRIMAAAFDELCDRELSPLSQLDACAVRKAIDAAVCESLGIDDAMIHCIREHLSAEPSVRTDDDDEEDPPEDKPRQMSFELC